MKTLLSVTLGIAAALSFGAFAHAQALEEVTVQGTRSLSVKTPMESPYKSISLSYDVNTEGLDLATESGAKELEKRVNEAASAACNEIGKMYPESTPSDDECARTAGKKAMYKVHRLIKAARQGSGKSQ